MKKLTLFLLSALMLFSLVGCGGSKIADGTYSAELSDAATEANHGWKDFLTVTYKDGKMVEVQFDSKDADGNLKSEWTTPKITRWTPSRPSGSRSWKRTSRRPLTPTRLPLLLALRWAATTPKSSIVQ